MDERTHGLEGEGRREEGGLSRRWGEKRGDESVARQGGFDRRGPGFKKHYLRAAGAPCPPNSSSFSPGAK